MSGTVTIDLDYFINLRNIVTALEKVVASPVESDILEVGYITLQVDRNLLNQAIYSLEKGKL